MTTTMGIYRDRLARARVTVWMLLDADTEVCYTVGGDTAEELVVKTDAAAAKQVQLAINKVT